MLDRYFDNPDEVFTKGYCYGSTLDTMVKAAVTNNIVYQMQVIQRQKNYFILPPALFNVQTRFSNNSIEQSNTTVENPEPESDTTTTKASTKADSFKCYYCDERFSSNDHRRNHRQQYHPDKKLDYPTSEDFEHRLDR